MKVLIVNSYDIHGGAARAVYRLHQALLKSGLQSNMIVQSKFSNDKSIFQCDDEWDEKAPLYDNMPLIQYPDKSQTLFSISTIPNTKLINFINNSDADVVHLHWITNGFLKIEDILKIQKPIVWSLHDMWAFTGGCHYDEECNKYKIQCEYCPVLQSTNNNDLSYSVFQRKKNAFNKLPFITFVGISKWLKQCAISSNVLNNKEVVNIPNAIDVNIFNKYDKNESRDYFQLPLKKKLILFGAISVSDDLRKGYKVLLGSLKLFVDKLSLEEKDNYEFVVFGNNNEIDEETFNINVKQVGYIDNDDELIKLYSAADLMIVPSLQENLSNAIMESLSCSTPVVAFNIGGNPDLIDHKINGYLANPFEKNDLANGINWVLNGSNYDEICENSRNKVVVNFNEDVVVKQYVKVYEKVIKKHNFQELLIYRPDSSVKFITKDIENWMKSLQKKEIKYVVYGHGTYGEVALEYLKDNIIAFVDQKSENISTTIVKSNVYHPSNLKNMKYDKIIITALGKEKEILNYLVDKLKIDIDKIISLKPL